MIKSEDISVVVQGAIDEKTTAKCLKSIRKYLPKSEIILSTWKNSKIKGLDYDILVENDDPGAVVQDIIYGGVNNTNRQLVSTKGGIQKASRKYILKIRTDFYLKGNNFLNYWDKFPQTDKQYRYINHRVIVASVYSRETSNVNCAGLPFHPSDFYFFGEADDVKKYFMKTDLMPDSDLANYNYKYPYKKPYLTPTMRYSPEQYLCLSFFKQFETINFDDWTDWNNENIAQSKNLLYSNFIFLGIKEAEIYSDKHSLALEHEGDISGLIIYKQFVKQYIKRYDPDFKENDSITTKAKFNKHCNIVIPPLKKIYKWFGEVISVIYYTFKLLIERLR